MRLKNDNGDLGRSDGLTRTAADLVLDLLKDTCIHIAKCLVVRDPGCLRAHIRQLALTDTFVFMYWQEQANHDPTVLGRIMRIFARDIHELEMCEGALVVMVLIRSGNESAVDLCEEGKRHHGENGEDGHDDD